MTPRRPPGSGSRWRTILRPPAGRITNQTLLVALVLVFGTGVATVAIGSPSGRWAAIAHGIAGLVILLLVPWKSRVIRGGLRGGRHTRWASLLLAALVVITFVAGLGYATGLVRSIAGQPGLWVHIAVALVLVPLVVWHIAARRIRPRRSDLSRRTFLRAGLLGRAQQLAAPGWSGSAAPRCSPALHRLLPDRILRPGRHAHHDLARGLRSRPSIRIVTLVASHLRHGRYQLGLGSLAAFGARIGPPWTARPAGSPEQELDQPCPVSALLRRSGQARSLLVHSVTQATGSSCQQGHRRLMLATPVGGAPLSVGHGYPLRLVAPASGRVLVGEVGRPHRTAATPWWWQPPFPVTLGLCPWPFAWRPDGGWDEEDGPESSDGPEGSTASASLAGHHQVEYDPCLAGDDLHTGAARQGRGVDGHDDHVSLRLPRRRGWPAAAGPGGRRTGAGSAARSADRRR